MNISAQTHFGMIIFVILVILAMQIWGRRSIAQGTLHRTNIIIGFGMISLFVFYNAYYFYPSQFNWGVSLPLQVCDILALCSGIVLVRPHETVRALLALSSIAFATQAFITPTGNHDPSGLRFWMYWLLHAGIVGCSLFDITINKFRPRMRHLVQVIIIDVLYISILLPINIYFGWNYGFIGNTEPGRTTLIDYLGPWPERIFVMLGLAILIQSAVFAALNSSAVNKRKP